MLEALFSAPRMLAHLRNVSSRPYIDDIAVSLEAIEAIVPPHLHKGIFRPPDKLIAQLKRAR